MGTPLWESFWQLEEIFSDIKAFKRYVRKWRSHTGCNLWGDEHTLILACAVFQCEIMVTSSKGVKNDTPIRAPESIRARWEIESHGTLRLGHIADKKTPHYVSIHAADSGGEPSSVSIEVRNKGKEAEFLEQLFDSGLDQDDFNGYLPRYVRAKARWEQGEITGFRLEGTDRVSKRDTAWHEVPAKLPQSWTDGLADLVRKALWSSANQSPGQDGWSVGHHSAVASGAEKKPALVKGKGAGGEGARGHSFWGHFRPFSGIRSFCPARDSGSVA